MTEFKCMIKKDKNSIWKNTQCTIGESNKMKCVKKTTGHYNGVRDCMQSCWMP